VAFVGLALIPIGAVTLYNVVAGHDFVIIASQGGVNFYIGNNPQSDGHTAIVPGTRADWWGGRFDTIKIAERAEGRPLKESEVSRYWFGQGLRFVTGQPGAWIGLTLRKLGLFWTAHEIGNNDCIPHLRSYAPIMKLPFFGFGLIAPLALAGIFLGWRRRRDETLLPLAFLVLYMLGVVAFFVCGRYRVPVVPFLILFAAAAITLGRDLWREGRRGEVYLAAAVFIAAALAMNLPARAQKENFALARFHDSVAWKKKGNLAASEQALRDALRLDPGLAEARTNLANLLSERGEGAEAGEAYEQAAAADPRNAKAWANLASYRLQAGDLAAAEEAVGRALAIDPDHSEGLRVQGVIRERRGDFAGARAAYEHALRFTREPERLENNLGVLCMREGDTRAAEEHLRRAVALDPTYAMAWANLGAVLGQSGRLAEAVDPLRRAAELQPGSPQGWTQLADVLRALGRTEEAEQALRRAGPAGR
jgi:Flp pilus assembly protein TadD